MLPERERSSPARESLSNALAPRYRVSPRSPWPFGTFFFAVRRLSAASDLPTSTVLPNVPSDFRLTNLLSPFFGSINSRLLPAFFRVGDFFAAGFFAVADFLADPLLLVDVARFAGDAFLVGIQHPVRAPLPKWPQTTRRPAFHLVVRRTVWQGATI